MINSDVFIDNLTQLPNKEAFFRYAQEFFNNYSYTNNDCLALIRLHIDKLHTFNASIGRNATDIMIAQFASRLQNVDNIPCEVMIFARLGGSDFVILLKAVNETILEDYVDNLYDLSHQVFLINQLHIYVNFSTGVAIHDSSVSSFDRLLNNAERALKQSLLLGGNICVWFDELEKSPIFSNVHLSSAFTHALKESEIIAYFQPKMAFDTKYFALEALIRWQHPILGLLSPKDFLDEVLDISSQSLFESIVKYCMLQILNWKKQGFFVKVAINIDASQLWHKDFLPFVKSCIAEFPEFYQYIEFEITETTQIKDHDKTIKVLRQLHLLGIKLAIDDFGTGFASLSYLLDYPIDYIKLDGIFVADIDKNPRHLQLVRSVIALAHDMNLQVIAEGVETEKQLELLKNMGCDVTQGYLHGKPMSADDVSIWLKNYDYLVTFKDL